MLYWLLQSQTAHPDLPMGQAPEGLLATEEYDQLDRFSSERRRRDWLLGRWTAKRLLQQVVEHRYDIQTPLHAITIQTTANGAPFTDFRLPQTGQGFSLSLSHKQGYAFCAVVEGRHVPVGADLEWIEPRDDHFVETFFSSAEQALLVDHKRRLYDMHVTALWSAKEAALKATGFGLHIDPPAVSCLLQPVAAEPQNWIPFKIEWCGNQRREQGLPELAGWWQTIGHFVLTVATPT